MENNLNVLDNARNLGNSIVESEEYKNLLKAEEDYYNDKKLTELLKELNDIKEKTNDPQDISRLEEKISRNKSMISYTNAKDKYDEVFKNINNLITYITDGQSRPITEKSKDTKDCSTCSGCSGGCSK